MLEHVVFDGLRVPIVWRTGQVGNYGRTVPGDRPVGVLVLVDQAKCMAELDASAPRGWDRKNMQIVIAANIVGRAAGPPHVVAMHFW